MSEKHQAVRRPRWAGWPGLWAGSATLCGWEIGHTLPLSASLAGAAPSIALAGAGLLLCLQIGFQSLRFRVWPLAPWLALATAIGASTVPSPPSPWLEEIHTAGAQFFVVTTAARWPIEASPARLRAVWLDGDWSVAKEPVAITLSGQLPPGTNLLVQGRLLLPEPGVSGRRIGPRIQPRRAFLLGEGPPPPRPNRSTLRQRWVQTCLAGLGDEIGGMAAAALFADRSHLGPALRQTFERTGTIHLLAISGFHISILAGAAWTAARVLTGGARWSRWVGLAALLPYAVLVEAPVSVVRSLAMATLILLGPDSGRGQRAWNGLGWVIAVLPLVDPEQPTSPGFCLSVSATIGVLSGARLGTAAARCLHRRNRPGRFAPSRSHGRAGRLERALRKSAALVFGWIGTSLGASILTTPWILYFFNVAYPAGLLVNLIAIPAMAIVLPALALAAAALFLDVPGSVSLATAAIFAGDSFLALLGALSAWSGQGSWSGAMTREACWTASAIGGVLLWLAARQTAATSSPGRGPERPEESTWVRPLWARWKEGTRWKRTGLGLVLAGMAVQSWSPMIRGRPMAGGECEIHVLSVGQGDAILVRSSREVWLFDLGPGDWGGRDRLIPHLRRLGVKRIDVAWVTHGDRDHWGGLIPLLGSEIALDTLALSGAGRFPEALWTTLENGARGSASTDGSSPEGSSRGSIPPTRRRLGPEPHLRPTVIRANAPLRRSFTPHLQFRLIHPWPGLEARDRNDASLAWVVDWSPVWASQPKARESLPTLLLVGDLERPGYDRLLERGLLGPVLIAQAGHHGSRTSVSPEAYEVLRPNLVLASLGRANKFGFPHRELLEELDRRNVCLLRTDENGSIRITLGPRRVAVRTEAGVDPLSWQP